MQFRFTRGRICARIGTGVVKAAKLGIKYSYKGAKVLGKEAALAVAKNYRELRLKRLIEDCYSPDRVTRIIARAKLRRDILKSTKFAISAVKKTKPE